MAVKKYTDIGKLDRGLITELQDYLNEVLSRPAPTPDPPKPTFMQRTFTNVDESMSRDALPYLANAFKDKITSIISPVDAVAGAVPKPKRTTQQIMDAAKTDFKAIQGTSPFDVGKIKTAADTIKNIQWSNVTMKSVVDRFQPVGADFATFGGATHRRRVEEGYEYPSTGDATLDKVIDFAALITRLGIPIPGLGMTPYKASNVAVGKPVGGFVEALSKKMANISLHDPPNVLNAKVWATTIVPAMFESGATLGTMTAVSVLMDPRYDELPYKDKAKAVGTSAVWGAVLGGIVKVAQPYMTKAWLTSKGFKEKYPGSDIWQDGQGNEYMLRTNIRNVKVRKQMFDDFMAGKQAPGQPMLPGGITTPPKDTGTGIVPVKGITTQPNIATEVSQKFNEALTVMKQKQIDTLKTSQPPITVLPAGTEPIEVTGTRTGTMPSDIPKYVQRIEEPDISRATIDKPHGIYTSPHDVVSPHEDLGGDKFYWEVNTGINVLEVSTDTFKTNRGLVGESAGIAAARHFLGDEEVARLIQKNKGQLIQEMKSKYPKVEWNKYYDQQEIVEGYAGMLAREAGHDGIWAQAGKEREFDEFVALTDKALKPVGEVPKGTEPIEAAGTVDATADKITPATSSMDETIKVTGEPKKGQISQSGTTTELRARISSLEKEIPQMGMGLQVFAKEQLAKYQKLLNRLNKEGVSPSLVNQMRNEFEKYDNKVNKLKQKVKDTKEAERTKAKAQLEKQKKLQKDKEAAAKKRQEERDYVKKLKQDIIDGVNQELDIIRKAETTDRGKFKDTVKSLQKKINKMRPHYKEALNELIGALSPNKINVKDIVKLTKTKNYFERVKEENPGFIMSTRIERSLELLDKIPIDDLTIEQVRELQSIIKAIVHQHTTMNQLIADKKARVVTQVLDESIKTVNRNGKLVKDTSGDFTKQDNKEGIISRSLGRLYKTVTLDPSREMLKLIGLDKSHPLYEVMYTNPTEGQRNVFKVKYELVDIIDKAYKKIGITGAMDGDIHSEQADKFWGEEVTVNTGETTLKVPKGLRVSLYMNMSNDQNVQHMTNGGLRRPGLQQTKVFSKEEIQYLRSNLWGQMTGKEQKFAQFLQEWSTVTADKKNEITVKLFGYEKATVKNYFRIVTDKDYSGRGHSIYVYRALKEEPGHLKERVLGASNPILWLNIPEYTELTMHETADLQIAPAIRDMNIVWGNPELREAIKANFTDADVKYFDTLMEQLDGKKTTLAEEKLLMRAYSNIVKSILKANLPVQYKQLVSYMLNYSDLDTVDMIAGIANYHKTSFDTIFKFSPVIRERASGRINLVTGDLAEYASKKGKSGVLKGILQKDLMDVKATWTAVEHNLKRSTDLTGDSLLEAVARKTEEIIYNNKPNYTMMQRSDILRSKGLYMKTLTAFSTQRQKLYSMAYESVIQAAAGNKKTAAKLLTALLLNSFTMAGLNYAIGRWFYKRSTKFSSELVQSAVGMFFLADRLYNAIATRFRGENILEGSIADATTGLVELGKYLVNTFALKGQESNVTVPGIIKKAVIPIVAIAQGIPAGTVERLVSGALKAGDWEAYAKYANVFEKQQPRYYYNPLWESVKRDNNKETEQLLRVIFRYGGNRDSIRRSANTNDIKLTPEFNKLMDKTYQDIRNEK